MFLGMINTALEKALEERISNFLQENTSFVVFEVNEKDERLALEKAIIGTVAQCTECSPSSVWLGYDSPKEEIKTHGLWQSQHMKSPILSMQDIEFLSSVLVR